MKLEHRRLVYCKKLVFVVGNIAWRWIIGLWSDSSLSCLLFSVLLWGSFPKVYGGLAVNFIAEDKRTKSCDIYTLFAEANTHSVALTPASLLLKVTHFGSYPLQVSPAGFQHYLSNTNTLGGFLLKRTQVVVRYFALIFSFLMNKVGLSFFLLNVILPNSLPMEMYKWK